MSKINPEWEGIIEKKITQAGTYAFLMNKTNVYAVVSEIVELETRGNEQVNILLTLQLAAKEEESKTWAASYLDLSNTVTKYEQRIKDLEEAANDLVQLKDWKAVNGRDWHYLQHKDGAWLRLIRLLTK